MLIKKELYVLKKEGKNQLVLKCVEQKGNAKQIDKIAHAVKPTIRPKRLLPPEPW